MTWAQALSWRLRRHLLEPSARRGVARSCAGSAPYRRWTSPSPSWRSAPARPLSRRRSRASSGARDRHPGVRVPGGRAPPLGAGRRRLPRPAVRRPPMGARQLGRVLRAHAAGLAGLPGGGPRGGRRRPPHRRRAGRGLGRYTGVPSPQAGVRRRCRRARQAAHVAGGREHRALARRPAHPPTPRHQSALARTAGPRRGRPVCRVGLPRRVRAGDVRPRPLLARRRPQRRAEADRRLAGGVGRRARHGRRGGTPTHWSCEPISTTSLLPSRRRLCGSCPATTSGSWVQGPRTNT